jgi:hypothetical protein
MAKIANSLNIPDSSTTQSLDYKGANARMGRATLVPVALSSSVVTVNNNTVTSSTEIFLCCNLRNGGPGILSITARNPGVSFTIASSAIGDASVVSWLLIEPSPP